MKLPVRRIELRWEATRAPWLVQMPQAWADPEDFDRLSVAHGLSLGAETLIKITAKEASDG